MHLHQIHVHNHFALFHSLAAKNQKAFFTYFVLPKVVNFEDHRFFVPDSIFASAHYFLFRVPLNILITLHYGSCYFYQLCALC